MQPSETQTDENAQRPCATLKDVARATGLAVSSVSYALRGAPNIPPATAQRVREAARQLGYRPNPRVAELMASVRRGHALPTGERIALVCAEGTRADMAVAGGFFDSVAAGARARAAEAGYALEVFWLGDMSGRAERRTERLASIIRARGITGIVFAPVVRHEDVTITWPWADFSMAVIGTAEWPVALSRAAHFHYEAMEGALRRLSEGGVRRPAAIFSGDIDERAHRSWSAAWLAHGPAGAARRLLMTRRDQHGRQLQLSTLAAWLRKLSPDALILDNGGTLAAARAAGWNGAADRSVLLSWHPGQDAHGIDQRYDIIAANAVDLVVAQLLRGQRGVPDFPRKLMFPGVWRTGDAV
ncbi:LacI family DNA-binding transcriptional regulator [Geminisphaera colitermitum]|uniref:LacI family DNA-binding transcriptional regulator n=1 Tax=Geminisphaera colitermitum TaxID=1148786 RepID=UPI0005BB8516|nr:LacI family DNA-binding transcriptional regulator [Geminisphaera colitermitum]